MSLKAFHIVFITAASALACGCGIWALRNYFGDAGGRLDLIGGVAALLASAGLVVYECYFLKKTRHVGYL